LWSNKFPSNLSKNGVTKAEKIDEATYKIEDVIEKPPLATLRHHSGLSAGTD
jgi:UTP-glucose-1-phosphate uridylyltransferase